MEIKIVLGEEEKRILSVLADAIQRGASCSKCVQTVMDSVKNSAEEEAEKAPASSETPQKPAEEAPAAPAAKSAPIQSSAPTKPITFGQVQKIVVEMSRKSDDLKAKVKAAMNKYSATLSGIPEDKFPEFLADLEAING